MTDTPASLKKTPTERSMERQSDRTQSETTLEWELRILDELTEMGLDMARALERRVQAQAAAGQPLSAPGGGDVGLAFERIAREICQTVALSVKLEQSARSRAAPPARRPAAASAPAPSPPALLAPTPGTKTTLH